MNITENNIKLYTHYVTPIFTKLNLLGLLHTIFNSVQVIPRRVEFMGYNYVVEILTYKTEEEAVNDLLKAIKKCGEELHKAVVIKELHETSKENVDNKRKKKKRRTEGELQLRFPYRCAKSETLKTSIQDLRNISLTVLEFKKVFCEQHLHDNRGIKGKAPPLLLAPDLGKFSSAKIPYENRYPNAMDTKLAITSGDRRKSGEMSLCTAMAVLGFEFCSFNLGFPLRKNLDAKYVVAFPSTQTDLDMVATRILYWIGRRFAWLTKVFEYRFRELEGLSIPGVYALLSPIVKDVSQSIKVLSELELTIYTVERDVDNWQWTYARDIASIELEYVSRLPNSIAGAMLANISSLKLLVEYVPGFFELLGEYMLSGDKILYIEALRSLASILHRKDVPPQVKSVARDVLEHGYE
ncbi:MAG: hypothetical protein QW607_11535 [Desulfurococcaceae archaeon]